MAINLLPVEVTRQQQKEARFYQVQSISIASLLVLIFLSSTTLALSFLQNSSINLANTNLQAAEEKVIQFKDKEGSLVILKNRLTVLDQIIGTPSKQRLVYNLVTALLPPSISPTLAVTDTSGNVTLTLATQDRLALDNYLKDLVNPEKNEGRVAKVDVESLSRGRDGVYRINLKIYSPEG